MLMAGDNSRQGAAIEVQHTAETPDAITITGTVMGIPKGIVLVADAPTASVTMLGGFGMGGFSVTIPTHIVPRDLRVGGTAESWFSPSVLIQTVNALVRF